MTNRLVNKNSFADLNAASLLYQQATPFPHLVVDDFLLPEIANRIHDEVRFTKSNVNSSNDITQSRKFASTDWDSFGDLTYILLSYFNSYSFLSPLEKITGISGLFGDPSLEGGGIHQTWRGGFLKMHTDFNWHEKLRADRRINIIYYLNKEWKTDYKGELIIQKLGNEMQKSIAPLFNRLVVFNTNDTTLHGHPHYLEFPEDYPRTSIAMYYYTSGIPVPERTRRKASTTRYLPITPGDIDLRRGSLRARLGYLIRRFTGY